MNDGAGNGLRGRMSKANDGRVRVYASEKHVDESNCGTGFKNVTCMLENI